MQGSASHAHARATNQAAPCARTQADRIAFLFFSRVLGPFFTPVLSYIRLRTDGDVFLLSTTTPPPLLSYVLILSAVRDCHAGRVEQHQVEVLEYPELGMEAIWKIDVEDFPAFIVVDGKGDRPFSGRDTGALCCVYICMYADLSRISARHRPTKVRACF